MLLRFRGRYTNVKTATEQCCYDAGVGMPMLKLQQRNVDTIQGMVYKCKTSKEKCCQDSGVGIPTLKFNREMLIRFRGRYTNVKLQHRNVATIQGQVYQCKTSKEKCCQDSGVGIPTLKFNREMLIRFRGMYTMLKFNREMLIRFKGRYTNVKLQQRNVATIQGQVYQCETSTEKCCYD